MNEIPEQDRVKLLPAPHTIKINFGGTWDVVTPAVYRYEDEHWIDKFFESGRLRLSTFAKFATYADEIRGDTREGTAFCYGETAEDKSFGVFQSQGVNAVVFCCSHKLDTTLRDGFQRNAAFQITNTVYFALEISRQLVGFKGGLEGSCIYRADASIKRSIDFDLSKAEGPDGNIDMQAIFDAGAQLGGPELLLLKQKHHERQQEYRLLWVLDTVGADYVDVIAPLARQFCRKIEPSEWA